MKIKHLHHWDITYKEAVNIQQELKGKLILNDKVFPRRISTIAGADISYSKQDDMFFAAVILLAYPTMDVIEEISLTQRTPFPYIPGLLSFREGPALLRAFEKMKSVPDCIIFDGQGIAHPEALASLHTWDCS